MRAMTIYTKHARRRMRGRGVTEEEVEQVIRRGGPSEARPPRLGRELVFSGQHLWRGRKYPQKRVKVVFVREGDDTVILTVVSYYGK